MVILKVHKLCSSISARGGPGRGGGSCMCLVITTAHSTVCIIFFVPLIVSRIIPAWITSCDTFVVVIFSVYYLLYSAHPDCARFNLSKLLEHRAMKNVAIFLGGASIRQPRGDNMPCNSFLTGSSPLFC